MITRRALAATGLATLGTGAAGWPARDARAQGQPRRVRIGYIGDFFGASLFAIANNQNLWARHGLTPELRVFTNGPIQVQALGAGSLDFGYIGPGALWLPASGRARLIAINAVGFSDRVVAQPGLRSMADLRGRRVGVPEGTSGDMLLRLALARANMQVSDLEAIRMDPSTIVAAFASRQIAAAGIWYPLVNTMRNAVPGLVELAQSSDFYPQFSFPSAFVARNEVVDGDLPLVRAMTAVLREANDFRAADVPRSAEITAGFLNLPVEALRAETENGKFMTSAELIAATRDGTVARWLGALNEQFISFGRLQNPLPVEQYYRGDLYAG